MTATPLRRGSLGIPARVSVEAMDRESLIVEAVFRCSNLESFLDIDWQPDDETCRRVGWWLVKHTGQLFNIGRRLLELSAPGGYLLPPPEFRLCKETEPTEEEEYEAPMLQPWSLILFQSGHEPAHWRLGGTLYHPEHVCSWIWTRLLYLDYEERMARTEDGWLMLGKRMHS
jgi:hypothetical protein